jgi:hypothetical protein
MTDKKLLELAAKACGLLKDGVFYGDDKWNPLENDGESLRLAVRLMLTIEVFKHVVSVFGSGFNIIEIIENDAFTATRRAIVKVAAEMGKEL